MRIVRTTATPAEIDIHPNNMKTSTIVAKVQMSMTGVMKMINLFITNSLQLEPKEAAHNLLRLHRVDNQEWYRISIHLKYISTIDVFYLL